MRIPYMLLVPAGTAECPIHSRFSNEWEGGSPKGNHPSHGNENPAAAEAAPIIPRAYPWLTPRAHFMAAAARLDSAMCHLHCKDRGPSTSLGMTQPNCPARTSPR